MPGKGRSGRNRQTKGRRLAGRRQAGDERSSWDEGQAGDAARRVTLISLAAMHLANGRQISRRRFMTSSQRGHMRIIGMT